MSATTLSQQEKDEFELIVQSGLFEKAPRLGRFFRYICERHFEGQGDQVKEYSIALEALGRSPDFDPKRDSIVRVEALRLRKRLEEYYAGPGANHPVQIRIPNGQYRPEFVARKEIPLPPAQAAIEALIPETESPEEAIPDNPSPISQEPQRRESVPVWVAIVAVAVIVGLIGIFTVRKRTVQANEDNPEVWAGNPNDPPPAEVHIMAGYHGSPFTDRQGRTWEPDAYYTGGRSHPIGADKYIESEPDSHFLRAQRSGRFRYDIPLRKGTYELHLYFAETDFGRGNLQAGGEASRIFRVTVNGMEKLPYLDPLAEAGGPNRLHIRILKDVGPAGDGKLHLGFDPMVASAFVNAIEILHSSPGRIRPLRIVAQASPVVDSDGRVWAADEYFSGGTTVFRRNVIENRPEKAIYEGERYGNFAYRLPLAPGKYRLTLHFAETWFGTPESGAPALDSRRFNVFANGETLLRDFDIAREAGGCNRSVTKVFDNLEPNAQGMMCLEFVPIRNYAEVNAIEIVETD